MTSAVFARLAKLIRLVCFIVDGLPSSMKTKSVRYTPGKGQSIGLVSTYTHRTEKGNTRWCSLVQCFSVLAEIPRVTHELAQLL